MQRRARVGELRRARAARFSSSTPRRCVGPAPRVGAAARGRARERAQRAGEVAVELGGDRPRMLALGLGDVDRRSARSPSPNAWPKPSRKSIGTPITSATSAPFEPGAARAREEERVVGRQAAAREPVEEDGDADAPPPARAARPRRGPSRGSCRP